MRPWSKAARISRFTLVTAAALVAIGACADSVTRPSTLAGADSPSLVPGVATPKTIEVCVALAAPAGVYTIDLSAITSIAGDAITDPVVITLPGTQCGIAFFRAGANLSTAQVTLTASTPAAGTFSYTCVDDVAIPAPPAELLCVGGTSGVNGAVAQANGAHGTTVTFHFVAAPHPPPPPPPPPPAPGIPTPLFVIGDVAPHGVGATVNFWGAQWSKNNFMSGFVANGVASFKGYASSADNFCGGTWSSRPGNSSSPPSAIGQPITIIVTSTVTKNGPNIGGNIVQILWVKHDGNYDNNPGHAGNGKVLSVACPP